MVDWLSTAVARRQGAKAELWWEALSLMQLASRSGFLLLGLGVVVWTMIDYAHSPDAAVDCVVVELCSGVLSGLRANVTNSTDLRVLLSDHQ